MNIIVGENIGFCFGVKRAVEGSLYELKQNDKKIYCLGKLVHNKEVINKLNKKGIVFVSNIDEVEENSKLIIRAHGADKKIYDTAKQKNIEIVDFTCPLVVKIHTTVEEYKNKGYFILLIGNKKHPEIIGTLSYCGDKYSIIEKEEELEQTIEKLLNQKVKNLLVITQTTYSNSKFKNVERKIKEKMSSKIDVVFKNTICNATEQRQKETEKLSQKVDLMIIIGGKNSSNTRNLYNISKKYCDSILIESVKDINIKEVKKYNKIGIMAGTSTSQESIKLVIKKLKKDKS